MALVAESSINPCYKDHIQYWIHKMNVFCATFYKLRTVLHKNQLIFAYKTYVQPILQYGVLIYGTAANSDIKKLNNKIKHLVRIIYGKRKFESIENFRIAAKNYNIEELHLYELLKLVIKKIRELNEHSTKNAFLGTNGLNKIKTQRICAKHLKFLSEGPINIKIISTKARKLLVKILKFQPRFMNLVSSIAKLSVIGCKDFAHRFRDNFILGSADLLEGFY